MVKKGEYYNYALSLEEKSIDYDPAIGVKEGEKVLPTETCMIVEIARKVKELEDRIIKIEGSKKE